MWGHVRGADKGALRLISLALMLALIMTGTGLRVAQADPGWYDAAWADRKKITIDSTKVGATLTDFPVLISLSSDTDLASDAQDDGDDILFTASDGITKLSHEIESFNGTSGQLVAWVRIPSLSSSTDTDIYMYYGHAGAGNQQNATFVWDSNYRMVQHLQETTGGANAIQDSTSNTNHGTDGGGPTFGATGKIDNAITFDGLNDSIDVADAASLDITSTVTVEAWINHASSGNEFIAAKWTSDQAYGLLESASQTLIGFVTISNSRKEAITIDTIPTGTWIYTAMTYDGTTVRSFLNGQEKATLAATGSIDATTDPLTIGWGISNTYTWDGTIDEVRVSDTARSGDWIQVSYNNQQYPDKAVHGASGFFSLGSEESGAPTAVGGVIYRVNRINVLAPWLFLSSVLALVIARGAFQLRKRV